MNSPALPRSVARSLALSAAGFFASISWQVVTPVLPLRLAHLGYSPAQIGLLVAIFSLTMAAVELQAGAITAAIGRRWSILAGYAANALCLVVAATAPARAVVAVSLAAVGAARGVLVPPLHATVADSAAAEIRGRAFGVFWLFAGVAFLTGPAIGGYAAGHYGDRAPFLLGALFSLAAIPMVAAHRVAGRTERVASPGRLTAYLLDPSILRVGVTMVLCYSLVGIWMTFLPLYASQHGASVVAIGWIFGIQGGMQALMQVPTGRLVALERGRWLAPASIAAAAATEVAVPLLHSAPALLAAGACYGVAVGTMPVTFATLVTRDVPPEQFTTAMSVFNSAIDLGLFVGPLLGAAAAQFSISSPFLLALPLGLIAVVTSLGRAHPVSAPAPGSQ